MNRRAALTIAYPQAPTFRGRRLVEWRPIVWLGFFSHSLDDAQSHLAEELSATAGSAGTLRNRQLLLGRKDPAPLRIASFFRYFLLSS